MITFICKGRLDQLEELGLSDNEGLTNQDIIFLAQAIGKRRLWKLEAFYLKGLDADKVTLLGVSAIALAVITRCPKLKYICLTCAGPNDVYFEMVMGMLAAAGRAGEVKLGDEAPVNEAENDDEEEEDEDDD